MNDDAKIAKLHEREHALLDERITVLDTRNAADTRLNVIDACLQEIRNALDLFGDIASIRARTAAKQAPEKPPRELCADEIDKHYPHAAASLPFAPADVDPSIKTRWNARTIRSALVLVYERRKKAVAAENVQPTAPAPLLEDGESERAA